MNKYGCMALVAIACAAAMPAAHAEGNFFVAGQVGQAEYDDNSIDDNSASTRAFSGGYRWNASPIIQVGVEAGFGQIDEVGGQFYYYDYGDGYVETGRLSMEADYRHLGATARFSFGEGSRWFAIVRGGYMAYSMDAKVRFETHDFGVLVHSLEDTASDDGAGGYFGGGVGVDVTKNFNVNLMFNGYAYSSFEDDYYSEDVGTASTTTLGVEVRF